ncbi:MAG TPA: helix-turn-helix transcriptional regulator [Thermoanaerobaculia bacterium]|jgi:transcriptional regulator with XRE-family HTH domain
MPASKKSRSDARQSARSKENQRIVADLLRQVREELGISQTELGARLAKPQSWVAKGERVERRVDLLEALAICDAMQYDPCELIKRLRRALKKADGH